jgi:hypothetical protein
MQKAINKDEGNGGTIKEECQRQNGRRIMMNSEKVED